MKLQGKRFWRKLCGRNKSCFHRFYWYQSIVHVIWKQSRNESEIGKPFDIKITLLQGRTSTLIGWSGPVLSFFAVETSDAGFNPIVILRSILRERHGTAPRFRSALFQLFIRCGDRARTRLACAWRAREETKVLSFALLATQTHCAPRTVALRFFSVRVPRVSVPSIIAPWQSNATRVFRHVTSSRVIKSYTW